MKILRGVVAAGFTALGLWFALRGVDWAGVRVAAAHVQGPWTLLAIPAAGLAEFLLRTERWRILLGAPRSARRGLFPTVAGAFFLNNVLPFRAGEAARVYWTHRRTGRPVAGCVAVLAVDRLWDMVSIGGLFLLAVASGGGNGLSTGAVRGLFAAAGSGLTGIALLVVFRQRMGAWVGRAPWPARVRRTAAVFLEGAAGLNSWRSLLSVVLLSAGIWGLNVGLLQLIAAVFHLILTGSQAAWLLGGLALGVALPSTPGYIGTFEAAGVAALVSLGMDRTASFSFLIVFHAAQILSTAIWGGPSLWVAGARSSSPPLVTATDGALPPNVIKFYQ